MFSLAYSLKKTSKNWITYNGSSSVMKRTLILSRVESGSFDWFSELKGGFLCIDLNHRLNQGYASYERGIYCVSTNQMFR